MEKFIRNVGAERFAVQYFIFVRKAGKCVFVEFGLGGFDVFQ
jgi:hypothetical protein